MAGILLKGGEGVKEPRGKQKKRLVKEGRFVPPGSKSNKPAPPRPIPRSGR